MKEYSGKTVVRMAKSLHKEAVEAAKEEGISLNAFLVKCIAEGVERKKK